MSCMIYKISSRCFYEFMEGLEILSICFYEFWERLGNISRWVLEKIKKTIYRWFQEFLEELRKKFPDVSMERWKLFPDVSLRQKKRLRNNVSWKKHFFPDELQERWRKSFPDISMKSGKRYKKIFSSISENFSDDSLKVTRDRSTKGRQP